MMAKFFPAKHQEKQFHCVHCGVYAAQRWSHFFIQRFQGSYQMQDDLEYCVCTHCAGRSYWFKGKMIVPSEAPVPAPHPEMPEACRRDYDEARTIFSSSPRAASALVRLALQKLMSELGESGNNLNADIGALVAKGLPVLVQQALDFCRVVGNNAVHPGEINIDDTPEIASNLFSMMNFIVEDRIARPKQIESLYAKLPEGARAAIDKRDEVKIDQRGRTKG